MSIRLCTPLFLALSVFAGGCSPSPQGAPSSTAAAPAWAPRPASDTGRAALARQLPPRVEAAASIPATTSLRVEPVATPARSNEIAPQALAVATSPAAGDSGVPVADVSGLGPSVSVQLTDPGAPGAAPAHLLVWEFELRGPDGDLVPAQVLAGGVAESGRVPLINDARLAEGSLVLVPLAPLDPGVTYTAYFTARRASGGAPVTRSWPFTTADG
jgi:hypothetical protein